MADEEFGSGPVAADSGAPLPGEVHYLEAMVPVLHEELKAAVGKHVTLHVSPDLAVTGTLNSYNEDTGVCLVIDRDRNYVSAGAVAVLQLRGTV